MKRFRTIAIIMGLFLIIAGCNKSKVEPQQNPTPPTDERIKEILVKLYNSTDGPNWNHQPNWITDRTLPLGEWDGVYLNQDSDYEDNYGIWIALPGLGLTGEIPSELFEINNLTLLELSGNSLYGKIPDDIGKVRNLCYLGLTQNNLEGNIPASLSQLENLKYLDVAANRLSGKIPSEICAMPWFRTFTFSPQQDGYSLEYDEFKEDAEELEKFRKFYDNLPTKIQEAYPWDGESLTTSEMVTLNNSGKIIALIFTAPYGYDAVIRTLPEEICELTNIRVMGITGLEMRSLPDNFDKLVNLRALDLNYNSFFDIPKQLFGMKGLKHLYITDNGIQSVPDEICGMTGLQTLILDWNPISGSISDKLGELPLKCISIMTSSEHPEEREFPAFVTKLSKLEQLWLCYLNIHGELPEELAESTKELKYFDMAGNNLTGNIPASYGGIKHLIDFNVRSNRLSGELPQAILDSPYFSYWIVDEMQDGYGFSNLPESSAYASPYSSSADAHKKVIDSCWQSAVRECLEEE